MRNCTVDLTAGGSKIELITRARHDPTYYDPPQKTLPRPFRELPLSGALHGLRPATS